MISSFGKRAMKAASPIIATRPKTMRGVCRSLTACRRICGAFSTTSAMGAGRPARASRRTSSMNCGRISGGGMAAPRFSGGGINRGALIGSALVGTFLGVFFAYGIVEPMSKRLAQIVEEIVDALQRAERRHRAVFG